MYKKERPPPAASGVLWRSPPSPRPPCAHPALADRAEVALEVSDVNATGIALARWKQLGVSERAALDHQAQPSASSGVVNTATRHSASASISPFVMRKPATKADVCRSRVSVAYSSFGVAASARSSGHTKPRAF